MSIKLEWKGNMSFQAHAESNHSIIMDASSQHGGENQGIKPMEMIIVGLGGCTGMDVVSILKKKRAGLENFTIDIQTQKAEEHPKVYTKIHLIYNFTGKGLKEEDVKHAIELSQNKYCSVTAMLEKTAEITYEWNIINS